MAVVIYCVSLFVGVKMISFVGCFAWVYLVIIYLCNKVLLIHVQPLEMETGPRLRPHEHGVLNTCHHNIGLR